MSDEHNSVNKTATIKKDEKKKEEQQQPAKIKVLETVQFDPNTEVAFANTIELADIVNGLFADSMRDYYGCKIKLDTGNPMEIPNFIRQEIPFYSLYVNLYFKDKSNDPNVAKLPIKTIKHRGNPNGDSANSAMRKLGFLQSMGATTRGRMYEIEKDTYDALDDFRFFTGRHVDWNILTKEIPSTFGYVGATNQEMIVEITGISLEKILNAVYGTEDGKYQYVVFPVNFVANAVNEHVVQITKVDASKLAKLRRSLGGPISNSEFHIAVR